MGFWGPVYYNYNKDPPKKKVLVIIQAPIVGQTTFWDSGFKGLGFRVRNYIINPISPKQKAVTIAHN